MNGARIRAAVAALGATTALVAAGCGSGSSLEGDSSGDTSGATSGSGGSATTLVVGSQDYYSNEIIAEVYAQALEAAGFTVHRDLRIGQREVYMPEVEDGSIDVFPEYSGNLLQYLKPDTTATGADEVYAELRDALPKGLRVLDQAAATDQDSYVVTKKFADEHGVSSLADLAGIDGLKLGGNSELQERPYGPKGLKSEYGVDVSFTPIEDSGGPLTVKAVRDDQVQLVDIYSADPVLAAGDLVVLKDPKEMFLASHVVPVVSDRVPQEAVDVIDRVSKALGAEDLIRMNARSVDEQVSASVIAADWLKDKGLAG